MRIPVPDGEPDYWVMEVPPWITGHPAGRLGPLLRAAFLGSSGHSLVASPLVYLHGMFGPLLPEGFMPASARLVMGGEGVDRFLPTYISIASLHPMLRRWGNSDSDLIDLTCPPLLFSLIVTVHIICPL